MDELFDAFDIPAEQRGALRAHLRRALGVAVRDDWWGVTKKRSIADPALTVSDAGAVAALERIDPRHPQDYLRLACGVTGYANLPLPPDRAIALAQDATHTRVRRCLTWKDF